MSKETIGQEIKRIREEKGMTQKELANKCGIIYQTIGKYERGLLKPKLETLTKIANALDVDIDELLDESSLLYFKDSLLRKTLIDKDPTDLYTLLSLNDKKGEYIPFISAFLELLNDDGKQKVIEYMRDIMFIDKYVKK